jgi:hypothetical protein
MLKTASMALITSFEGMAGWRQSWEDFKTSRNINAQIAHDIDLLENYFQLGLLRKNGHRNRVIGLVV